MRHLTMASSSRTVIDGLRWCSFGPPFQTRHIDLSILASRSSQTSLSSKMTDSGGSDTKVEYGRWSGCWRLERTEALRGGSVAAQSEGEP
ncbi:hypothetical protein ES332_A10G170400v1 [Gossypium tomentosum]|uniref:Uncharacterized protein n=1 Tax=Gossypium tomentosum TaxID=34277 RepID=A0A5D2NR15_GOSTO|nr:hypothetical protein ES332_A10G170400v1 [Gossypium tomentosum]